MARTAALDLIKTMQGVIRQCPAHGGSCGGAHSHGAKTGLSPNAAAVFGSRAAKQAASELQFNPELPDYAVEIKNATLRYGHGVTREVGFDLKNIGCKKVAVYTDKNVFKLPPFQQTIESIEANGVEYCVFTDVKCEPSHESAQRAIEFARKENVDAYVAVGGGSVMDTCKMANLCAAHKDTDVMDFVIEPLGKGYLPWNKLKYMIAIPTTAGTGSETTGTAVLSLEEKKMKCGVQLREVRPQLGLIDPAHLAHMPRTVAAYSGFDVLCHGLESYTNIPYNTRKPRPLNPKYRPIYQGSNPVSDIWSTAAVKICENYLRRSYRDVGDQEASDNMALASSFAGVGFGSGGVHLCHGLSYAISGHVKGHQPKGYGKDHPIIPHGLSVVITAPAVFKATAPSNPRRHLFMAECLGADISNAKEADAGLILADRLRAIMQDLDVENGIKGFGYSYSDIPALVENVLPQDRLLRLSPIGKTREDVNRILEESLTVY